MNAYYNEVFVHSADMRVENWALMSSPMSPVVIIVVYLYAVYKLVPDYMENRKPYKLKKIIQVYNILQIASCFGIIYGFCSSGWVTNFTLGCWPVDYSNEEQPLRMLNFVWWTLILKMVELVETFFFLLRKKHNQVTKLHVYHHASTFLAIWLVTKYVGGGMASIQIVINSFIHVLMYTYYFLSTLSPTIQRKIANLKPRLTMLQMIQFCILLVHGMQGLSETCNISNVAVYMFIPNIITIFGMFINFYIKTYNAKKQK